MARKKKKSVETLKISVADLEVNSVYKTFVGDVVKILDINKKTETVVLYNISGSHTQWTAFKYVNIIKKLY